jgi:AcrR family transcriptional regulator
VKVAELQVMDEKRKFILETAAKFFSKNGFFTTSVQDIAKACNISKATIYQLFNSKEDILYNIIQYKHDQIIQEAALIIRNNQIKNLFDETQRVMMYWHKESLSKAYGPKVDF